MTSLNHILLLGAGFSRNWGGWLADEAFEYLLGCTHLERLHRDLLWQRWRTGGFEAALADLQQRFVENSNPATRRNLQLMQDAILEMFRDMDAAFASVPLEFSPGTNLVGRFLVQFSAIFTLNQDLLLERHYLNDNVSLLSAGRWDGYQIPGMRPTVAGKGELEKNIGIWEPHGTFDVHSRCQPYFKLHGSSNWNSADGQRLLVMGADKSSLINQTRILETTFEQFKAYISRRRTRLMIIGYSFADAHVNATLIEAASKNELQLFVVDPLGLSVLDQNRDKFIPVSNQVLQKLQHHVIGASRRQLAHIFGNDKVEYSKIARFFLPLNLTSFRAL